MKKDLDEIKSKIPPKVERMITLKAERMIKGAVLFVSTMLMITSVIEAYKMIVDSE